MKNFEIDAVKREAYGKKESKKLHREGMIPCALYGNGETVHFAISARDAKPLIYTPNSYIINVNLDGKKEIAVMREVQYHPVKEQVLHIDFYRAVPGKEVAIDIPVRLTGNSIGVKLGGKLSLAKRKIHVKGILENLPDELVVDVTDLELGKSIFVGDLQFDGLTLLTPAVTAVAAVKMTRAARGAAAAAAAAAEK
ncbi:MAG: 50S ribosomal protein L25 [Alistipes sp.]|nr:50S ribosomal protein L25 [Alistipes sp.]